MYNKSVSTILKNPKSYQNHPNDSWEKFILSLHSNQEYLDLGTLPDEAGFLLMLPSGKVLENENEIDAKSKVAISSSFAFNSSYATVISDARLFNGLVKHGRLFVEELKKFQKIYLFKFNEEELARLHGTLTRAKIGDLFTGRSHLVGNGLKSYRI